MSFASSLHSSAPRKSGNKDASLSSVRNRPSPPNEDSNLSTSPPDEEEEGWSKVRSGARGSTSKGSEKRGMRGERKGGRENLDGSLSKTAFRNNREGDSQNWRSDRLEFPSSEQSKNGRPEERPEFLEEQEEFGGSGEKEHSAEEFQAWITRMRGGNAKFEEKSDSQNDSGLQNGTLTGINVGIFKAYKQINQRLKSQRC